MAGTTVSFKFAIRDNVKMRGGHAGWVSCLMHDKHHQVSYWITYEDFQGQQHEANCAECDLELVPEAKAATATA